MKQSTNRPNRFQFFDKYINHVKTYSIHTYVVFMAKVSNMFEIIIFRILVVLLFVKGTIP